MKKAAWTRSLSWHVVVPVVSIVVLTLAWGRSLPLALVGVAAAVLASAVL